MNVKSINNPYTSSILEKYGKVFCDEVGLNTLLALPEIAAEVSADLRMDLANERMHIPSEWLDFSKLGNHSAVRGLTPEGYPFIAGKVELLRKPSDIDTTLRKQGVEEQPVDKDEKGHNIQAVSETVLEMIYKIFSLDELGGKGAVYEHNYTISGAKGSYISSKSIMPKEDLQRFGSLLRGESVKHHLVKNLTVRIAPPEEEVFNVIWKV